MKLTIVAYPDKRLRLKSKDVTSFDKKLHNLLDSMYQIMMDTNGVGLAAIQVGIALNVLIINIPVKDETSQEKDAEIQLEENLIEAVNPTIIKKDGEYVFNEGCLSVPGFNADVTRSKDIEVRYFDRFGKEQFMNCEEFLAVAWQHEMEHLSGHVFVDNLSFLKRKRFEKEWKKELKNKSKKGKR